MARKKKTGKQMVSLEALKQQARQVAAEDEVREAPSGGTFLKALKGCFSVGDESLPDELSVIILDYGFEQVLYPSDYAPGKVEQPTCFAVAYKENDLQPHEESEHPEASACEDCELAQWEGAEPPDCNARRRLALIDATIAPSEAQLLILNLSPGMLKAWRGYPGLVKKKTGLPLYGVITTLSWDHNKKNIYGDPTLRIEFDCEIDDEQLFARALELHAETQEPLLAPIRVVARDSDDGQYKGKKARPPAKKGKGKKVPKRAPAKKKAPPKKKRNRRY